MAQWTFIHVLIYNC